MTEDDKKITAALRNAVGLAIALDLIIKDYPEVSSFLPGLTSCRKNIEEALKVMEKKNGL